MSSSTQLWQAWTLAEAYHKTPSEIYCIRDEVAAWCFNRAVHLFGSQVSSELKQAAQGAKNNQQAASRQGRVLSRYGLAEARFRDPAASSSPARKKDDEAPMTEVDSTSSTGSVKL